jgi:hypothetical protein
MATAVSGRTDGGVFAIATLLKSGRSSPLIQLTMVSDFDCAGRFVVDPMTSMTALRQ